MRHFEIRDRYLNFFKSKGHRIVPSDSLVPAGDPTLLFTSAGMTQFKDEFMGNIKDFTRAASCQKCMRTADLENVGKTRYHQSFFEMLGNFSFGDYFKDQAIVWAREFLTDILKLESQSLWVSVYENDQEAYTIWSDIVKIPECRIVRLGQKDNFWPSEAQEKGPNGPCGPCSEIYYDYGKDTGCRRAECSPACSCGRFVEVWNLVFTQYERADGGTLRPLPKKNIDTGMGLERLCTVMQRVDNNFQTDLFVPITETVEKELDVLNTNNPEPIDNTRIKQAAYRRQAVYAIADHVRAITFAISDGITPSNEERGYVVRNILRKALLHAIDLGAQEPVLYKIVYSVAKTMERPYPELMKKHQDIAELIRFEEQRFYNTLSQGRKLLDSIIMDAKKYKKDTIPGHTAFRLFDTHGLPLAIIKQICSVQGLAVDEDGFNHLMGLQREQSRKSSNLNQSVFVDSGINEKTQFIGYEKTQSSAKVIRILLPDGNDTGCADASVPRYEIVLDRSVFYPQQGGQEPDTGRIFTDTAAAEVLYAKKINDDVLLDVRVLKGSIKKGDIVETCIDRERRFSIAQHHTATHLLQSALRRILGEHVQQQGSFVGADRLRFDFTHFKAMTEDELSRVEAQVNDYIKQGHDVQTQDMDIEQARQTGALAFFNEKYSHKVRVVKAGDKSLELCGGTHLENTSLIDCFRIMRETSVASGIRRIEAVVSNAARQWEIEHDKREKEKRIALERKQQEKIKDKMLIKKAEGMVDDIIADARHIKDSILVLRSLKGYNINALKRIMDIIKTRIKTEEYIIFFLSADKEKILSLLGVGEKFIAKGVDASRLLADILKSFSGSGGGRPDMAQGGIKKLIETEIILKTAEKLFLKELE